MDYKIELAVWSLASLALFALGAWLAWQFRHSQSRSADWLRRRVLSSVSGRAFLQIVRLIFYVGLPYATILRRALPLGVAGVRGGPDVAGSVWWMLGWSEVEWMQSLDWAARVGVVAAVLLALSWRNAVRAAEAPLSAEGVWPAPPWWVTLREALYDEIHWAFYRAWPLVVLGDAYWAVLIGAAMAVLEWMLDPDWWAQARGGPRRELVLVQCTWLATSAICFYLTRNLWTVVLVHVVLALAQNAWLTFLAGREAQAEGLPAKSM